MLCKSGSWTWRSPSVDTSTCGTLSPCSEMSSRRSPSPSSSFDCACGTPPIWSKVNWPYGFTLAVLKDNLWLPLQRTSQLRLVLSLALIGYPPALQSKWREEKSCCRHGNQNDEIRLDGIILARNTRGYGRRDPNRRASKAREHTSKWSEDGLCSLR